MSSEDTLSELELDVLAFEGSTTWRFAGVKEDVIRNLFDMTPTRYYQLLNALIDKPSAVPVAPTLVHRLRRLREERQLRRA